ncbi:hypothetical protein [Lysinibacillus sp. NPDC096212]|uniref:hypothetical protein n=1 Tax=Lysinibacillus sp. NPDC096212 TaxID=3364135 RepID=UPI0038264C75
MGFGTSIVVGTLSIIISTLSLILSNYLSDENTKFWVENEQNRLEEYHEMNSALKTISDDLIEYKNISDLDTLEEKQRSEILSDINETLEELQIILSNGE